MWKTGPEPDPQTGMWYVSGPDGRKFLSAGGQADAQWLQEVLDDATNTTVKLYCMSPGCRGHTSGEFITRPVADTKKNVYQCDICKRPMGRRTPQGPGPGPIASEKQGPVQPTLTPTMPGRLGDLARVVGIVKPSVVETPPTTPAPADSPVPTAGMQRIEERLAVLEEKVVKLEGDSANQAETAQTLLQLLEGMAMPSGAQTT